MQDERLIEAVRSRDFLYNIHHPKYMDTKYKRIAWRDIAEELGQPVIRCKTRWQNIRDTFRKYCAWYNATRNGQGTEGMIGKKPYKYGEMLQFLHPYLLPLNDRGTVSSVRPGIEEASSSTSQTTCSDGNAANVSEVHPNEEEISRPPRKKRQAYNKANLVDCVRELTQLTSVMVHLISKDQTENILFFKSLALSILKLNSRRQQYAKEKMLRLVNKLLQENDRDEECRG